MKQRQIFSKFFLQPRILYMILNVWRILKEKHSINRIQFHKGDNQERSIEVKKSIKTLENEWFFYDKMGKQLLEQFMGGRKFSNAFINDHFTCFANSNSNVLVKLSSSVLARMSA